MINILYNIFNKYKICTYIVYNNDINEKVIQDIV